MPQQPAAKTATLPPRQNAPQQQQHNRPNNHQQQRPNQQRPGQQHNRRGPGGPSFPQPQQAPVVEEAPKIIAIDSSLTVGELAQVLKVRETEIIKHLFMKGKMVTVNQTLDVDFARDIARELGFEVILPEKKEVTTEVASVIREPQAGEADETLIARPPVVSIMGHVDHGKTSLLDAIRAIRQKIVDTEAGGITQSIGAYTVVKDEQRIVFLDTPGHEAFTAMRMRGAKATDIAILVVAADDGVMPQTIEAINHAKAAGIPIIVAVNKIDKAGADPDRVLMQLSEHGLVGEKWGGDTITVEVSALQKLGIDDLLEMILLVSELQTLKANPTVPAEGVIIEARLDKGKGPVATALVQKGTLRIGDNVFIGSVGGRVRALLSDSGERVNEAGPSTPVEIIGLSEVPRAGDAFRVVTDDKEFRNLVQEAKTQDREQRLNARSARVPGMTGRSAAEGQPETLNIIIKADTQGSAEAVLNALSRLSTDEVRVGVLHTGTGDVSEADVMLATASNALIIAFNVRQDGNAMRVAEQEGIRILSHDIIYHVVEDIEKRMLGQLSPEVREVEAGKAEVRQLFTVGKTRVIAGCMVQEGKINRNAKVKVTRNGKEIYTGQIEALKRFKDDVREVAAGYECGISLVKFNDLISGDIITAFATEETERTSL
jgi:translation initiation factor IF-2